jgi:hypothetical protein
MRISAFFGALSSSNDLIALKEGVMMPVFLPETRERPIHLAFLKSAF